MMRKWARFMVALGAFAACPVLALGLGEISVHSRLDQPFAASIPVLNATPAQLDNLTVRLASPEEFNKAGIERSDYLSTLQFELEKTDVGASIRISSPKIAREPFLNFIVEARLPQSRLLREYTVLLDPPELAQAPAPATAPAEQAERPAAEPETPVSTPVEARPSSAAPAPVTPPNAPVVEASPASSAPPPAAAQTAAATYGPIQAGETLWSIATKLRPDPSISMDQVLLALYRANPSAFENGRLDGLLKGATLRVPSAAEMRSVSAAAAKSKVDALRGGLASVTPPKPPAQKKPSPEMAGATMASPPAPASGEPGTLPQPQPAPEKPPAESAPSAAAAGGEPAPSAPAASANPPATSEQPSHETPAPTAAATQAQPPSPAGSPTTATTGAPASNTTQVPPAHAAQPAVPKPAAKPGLALDQYAKPLVAALVVLIVGFFGWRLVRGRHGVVPDLGSAPVPPATGKKAAAASPPTPASPSPAAPAARPGAPNAAFADTGTLNPVAQKPAPFEATRTAAIEPALVKTASGQSQKPQKSATAPDNLDFDLTSQFEAQTVAIDLGANDPLSEADFHLAYGLYDEAATLLKQALAKEPQRTDLRQKLAETYFAAGKPVEFQETAEALHGQLPAPDWEKLAIMGRQLCPDAALFKRTAGEAAPQVDLQLGESLTALAAETAGKPEPATAAPAPPSPATGNVIDFDLDAELLKNETASAPKVAAPEPAQGVPEIDLSQFDLTHEPAPPPDDGRLEFKLDELTLDKPAPAEPIAAPSDEIATKLDLARAYADMGDNEAARGLLQEVLETGNAAQKSEAEALSKRLSA
ncbi:MAG: FimV/HubP family polar landmark protein [Sinobacteraceae bacterium]|nr:FimV/HubP family polar landmark protein [Nevskiaceae bacterium]